MRRWPAIAGWLVAFFDWVDTYNGVIPRLDRAIK
jgi:hypothetical protein